MSRGERHNLTVGWTDERVDKLIELWKDGLSASQIATRLGGVSRSSVIGKVHRLGISYRDPASPPPPKAGRPRKPGAVGPAAAPRAIVTPAPAPEIRVPPAVVKIAYTGRHGCKWPIGDPAAESFSFCEQKAADGKPYCVEHARAAYQPRQKKAAERDRYKDEVRTQRRWL